MPNKKNFIILGSSLEASNVFKMLSKEYNLIIFDKTKNDNTINYSTLFYRISSYSHKKIIKILENLAKKIKFFAITNISTDNTYSVARVAKRLKLKFQDPKIANISNNKIKQKKILITNKIKTPEYKIVRNLNEIKNSKFKNFIIKPIDSRGARGVMYLNKTKVNKYWKEIKNNSKKKIFLIEKFINGPQFSLEAIVHNKKIKVFPLSHRNYETTKNLYPYMIEDGGQMPYKCTKQIGLQIKNIILNIINSLGYHNGALKLDLVMDKKNNLFVIEFATRTSGGYLSTYDIPKITGIDYYKHYFNIFKNKNPYFKKNYDDELLFNKPKFYITTRYLMPKEGYVKSFYIKRKKGIKLFNIKLEKNKKILKPTDHTKRYGRITSFHTSKKNSLNNLNKYLKTIKINYK